VESTQRVDQLLGDEQPQARARRSVSRRSLRSVELAEDPLSLRGRNAHSLVDDANLDSVCIASSSDRHLPALRRVAECVLDEDVEHLPYLLRVSLGRKRLVGQVDLEPVSVDALAVLDRPQDFGHDRADVDPAQLDM
jgi:hypothetical protein